MAGFKIRLIDGTYIGFNGNNQLRTNFKDGHIYSSVLNATNIIKIMLKWGDIKQHEQPMIVNMNEEVVRVITG